jgi:hypothetical protein
VPLPETASVRLPCNRKVNREEEQERALPKATGTVTHSQQAPARNCRRRQTTPAIQCSPEEFNDLRKFLHQFAATDRNWRPLTRTLEFFRNPPDDAITASIAAVGNWNIREIIRHFRVLKESGKRPDLCYGWFDYMIKVAGHRFPPKPEAVNGMRSELPSAPVSRPSEPLNHEVLWDRVRVIARQRIGEISYSNWFEQTYQAEVTESQITVAVPDRPTCQFLVEEYGELLIKICGELGAPCELVLQVADDLKNGRQ